MDIWRQIYYRQFRPTETLQPVCNSELRPLIDSWSLSVILQPDLAAPAGQRKTCVYRWYLKLKLRPSLSTPVCWVYMCVCTCVPWSGASCWSASLHGRPAVWFQSQIRTAPPSLSDLLSLLESRKKKKKEDTPWELYSWKQHKCFI